jgi:transposase
MPSEKTVYVAIELSLTSWLVAERAPGIEKPRLHRLEGGDAAALLKTIGDLRSKASAKLGCAIDVVCCFEAGRDGFWLHRLLAAHGIAAYVLEPASILVNRRARRAKTDRLDAEGMLRVLATWLAGDRQVCSMVRVTTPDEEDAKRPHREREHLVQDRLRIENRIEALLFAQGISASTWCRIGCASRTASRHCCSRKVSGEGRHYAPGSATWRRCGQATDAPFHHCCAPNSTACAAGLCWSWS